MQKEEEKKNEDLKVSLYVLYLSSKQDVASKIETSRRGPAVNFNIHVQTLEGATGDKFWMT